MGHRMNWFRRFKIACKNCGSYELSNFKSALSHHVKLRCNVCGHVQTD